MEMSPTDIHKKLMEFGVSDLDAGLVVNCVQKMSSYTWLNTDPISKEQINNVNEYFAQNDIKIKIEMSEVPHQGKYIWDVKLVKPPVQQTPSEDLRHQPNAEHPKQRNLGPEGRFRSLSELGL
jgi:hypothetical protein